MCDGKDRARAFDDFDEQINAPIGGWEQADQRLLTAIRTAE